MNDRIASVNENGEYDPYIISLSDEDGTEYEFEVLDDVDYNDARYLALLPVEEDEDATRDSGELVILKAVPGDDPTDEEYEEIADDAEYEDVAALFADRLQDLFDIEED